MRWRGLRESSNVEDRRGGGSGRIIGGGIGTIVIALVIWLLGGNPGELFNFNEPSSQTQDSNYHESAQEHELKQFVSVVLAETEDTWTRIFQEKRSNYRMPKLVLYTNSIQSACGFSSAAVGPFYCPGDEKLYIDLSFYDDLQRRFHAPGDFAMAYVVAHEVGHHIQNLLGITDKVHSLRSRLSEEEYNKYSVRLELQADYFAGVWAHYADKTKNIVEQGDIDEALNAASAVGDDMIQKQTQGYVVPESFTHGTSEQRKRWFYKGYKSGNLEDGDTFGTNAL
ncbi:MAG: neutral zinc metallopeptidase [Bacillota bacterium]